MKLESLSPLAWIVNNDIRTETGVSFDLRTHPFLMDIITDFSPEQVMMKAAQVGLSVTTNLKLLWAVKHKKINAAYTMPTAQDVKEFVGGKTNMLIANNKCLSDWVKDRDTIEQKQVGNNLIYFRGTFTERAALSFSSDLNVHDEADRSDVRVVEQYESRLQHSPYKWKWIFSNPSVEGNITDRFWKKSDMKEWFVTCPACSHSSPLKWPDNVDVSRGTYVCSHCRKDIPDEARRKGKWQKTGSGDVSGYRLSLLMAPYITAKEVIKLSEKPKDYFANFVLGETFIGDGGKLREDEFFSNLDSKPFSDEDPIVIGMDTGLPNYYVIGNRHGLFYAASCDGYDEVRRWLDKYKKAILVIDQGGDLSAPRELQDDYRGRVFLCYYREDRKTMRLIEWGNGVESGKVIADRNRVIQMLMDEMRTKRIPLKGSREQWWPVWLHINNTFRSTEDDRNGNLRIVWQRAGPDHFLHACWTGDTLITTKGGGVPIKDIKVGDYVLTREGFRRVTFSEITNPNADVIEVEFENGEKLRGTPTHKVWTENRGWVELQSISMNDILVSIWNNNSTERLIACTKENAIYQTKTGCTATFGSFIMEKFLKAFTFIIKTIIRLITTKIIWNWWTQKNTYLITVLTKFLRILSAKSAELGINQKTREIIGIARSSADQKNTRKDTIKWKGDVASVKNDLPPISISGVSHVLKTVRVSGKVKSEKAIPQKETIMEDSQAISHIRFLKNKETVYGLTVDDMHEYFANGILVKNCAYWRIGMEKFGVSSSEKPYFMPSGNHLDKFKTGIYL